MTIQRYVAMGDLPKGKIKAADFTLQPEWPEPTELRGCRRIIEPNGTWQDVEYRPGHNGESNQKCVNGRNVNILIAKTVAWEGVVIGIYHSQQVGKNSRTSIAMAYLGGGDKDTVDWVSLLDVGVGATIVRANACVVMAMTREAPIESLSRFLNEKGFSLNRMIAYLPPIEAQLGAGFGISASGQYGELLSVPSEELRVQENERNRQRGNCVIL